MQTAAPAAPAPARDHGTSTGSTSNRPLEEGWEDGNTLDEATLAAGGPNLTEGFGGPEEMTVEEPAKPSAPAKLVVIAGNDTGREFVLAPGKPRSIGRAMENDVVLTDIAVSRKHLDVVWEGGCWLLKDRGSGNGTLVNDRIEDGAYRLLHNDRIEIGHTVFRFDHAGSPGAGPDLGWTPQSDDEASTVAGRVPARPTPKPGVMPAAAAAALPGKRQTPASTPPPVPAGDRARPQLPPPRAHTPSQVGGALSARLALPANPGPGAIPVEETPPPPGAPAVRMEPSFLMAPSAGFPTGSDALSMRSMTATAHVEPLTYSGSIPPISAYVRVAPPPSRRKQVVIASGVCAGIVLIGVVAMLAGSEPAPSGKGSGAPSTMASTRDGSGAEPGSGSTGRIATSDGGSGSAEAVVIPEDDKDEVGDEAAPPTPVPDVEKDKIVPPTPVPDVKKDKVVPPTPDVKKDKVVPPTPVPVVKKDKDVVAKKDKDVVKKDKDVVKKDKDVVAKKEKTVKADKTVKAGGADGAKKKAQSLYAAKDFKGAAAAVRDAASTAAPEEIASLKKLASDYDALASSMNAGNSAASSKATDALTAYKKALKIDKRLGGTHAPMIREKLAVVAPKAAAGFMAKGNYEAAKQAADTAVNFGAGSSSTITGVRQSLERKAGEFYASGQKILSSKPEDAKAMLRRVLKIVPPDSPWYTKAYKALNTRTTKKDDDE